MNSEEKKTLQQVRDDLMCIRRGLKRLDENLRDIEQQIDKIKGETE